jgi:hypothetical protein
MKNDWNRVFAFETGKWFHAVLKVTLVDGAG